MAATPRPTPAAIRSLILLAFGSEKSIEWHQIVNFIDARVSITNWLTQVRSPLQGLLNEGVLVREPNVHKEQYNRK